MTRQDFSSRVMQGLIPVPSATRKDIQALRAIAVGIVVLNHLWPDLVPGGYVGVDVFFVISGYLISKHLLGELERTDRIALGQFYARRIKRLLPAAMVVAVVSLVGAWLLLPFSRWLTVAEETIASVLYVENWMLAGKSVDYSAHNDAASTVQHYWSLSVEEQFYLVWPLLFLGLFMLAARTGRRRKAVLAAGIIVASILAFVFCVWFTYFNKSQAYFVTPARVWEFGAGALISIGGARFLAVLRLKFPEAHLALSGVTQWLGYGLIAASAFLYNEETYFPGVAAAVPVLGTVLVIASGPDGPAWSPNRLLGVRPVQFLGDVSYSLYLWHWPLIVLAPAALTRNLDTPDRIGILILAVGLAYLSKKSIEDPGRTKLLRGAKPVRVFGAMVVASGLVCSLGGGLVLSLNLTQRAEAARIAAFSNSPCYGARSLVPSNNCADPFGAAKVSNVGRDEAPWFNAPECKPAQDPIRVQDQRLLIDCDFTGGAPATETVWLVGDSHAEQWKKAVYDLAREHRWRLKESLLGGCPFVDAKRVAFMGAPSTDPTIQQRCLSWGNEVTARIATEKPDFIFVSSFGAGETIDDGSHRPQLEQYRDAVTKRFTEWTASGSSIFVLRDTPLTLGRSTPECVALNREEPVACANSRTEALLPDPVAEAARSLAVPNVNVLDLADQFCTPDTCHAVIGGIQVYYDTDHASRSYIQSMVPVLSKRFAEARQ